MKRRVWPYSFLELPDSKISCVKVRKGPYRDLVVRFGKVHLSEEEGPDGNKKFQFEYNIIENPGDYEQNDDMFTCLGDILVDIIRWQGETRKLKRATETVKSWWKKQK